MPDPALDRTDETLLVPKSLHQMWEKHRKATYYSGSYYSMSPMMMYELEFSPDLLCPCFQLCIHCTESFPLKLSQVPELFCLLWNPLRRNLQWSSWTRKKSRWPSAQRSPAKGSPSGWVTANSVETVWNTVYNSRAIMFSCIIIAWSIVHILPSLPSILYAYTAYALSCDVMNTICKGAYCN